MRTPMFFLVITLCLSLVLCGTVIYLKIYTKKINQRLHQAHPNSQPKLWSPLRFCLSLALFMACCLIAVSLLVNQIWQPQNHPNDYHLAFYTSEQIDQHYLANYALEANPGYTAYQAQNQDFQFTCFISQDENDPYHPQWIVYIRYLQDDLECYSLSSQHAAWLENEQDPVTWSTGGAVPDQMVVFIGTADHFQGLLEVKYALFDDKAQTQLQEASQAAWQKDQLIDDLPYASKTATFQIDFAEETPLFSIH